MGTKFEGDEATRRALDAYVKFARAYDSVQRELSDQLRREGLTTSQLGVLEALLHLGPLGQTALAEKLLTSASNITTVIDNLEREGLVERTRSEEDRRRVQVSLTENGRNRIEDVFPRHAEKIRTLTSALSDDELEELGRLCRKLGRSIESKAD